MDKNHSIVHRYSDSFPLSSTAIIESHEKSLATLNRTY